MAKRKKVGRAKAPIIKAWSAHRVTTWEQCPAKLHYSAIDRIEEAGGPSEALVRGANVHKLGEQYLKGTHSTVPTPYKHFHDDMVDLREAGAHSELEWAFDAKWRLVPWASDKAWCRMKLDVFVEDKKKARLIDFKTGKMRMEPHEQQLDLYALGGFYATGCKEIEASMWYLDTGQTMEITYDRTDVPDLEKEWVTRAKKLLNDRSFLPTPGTHCRWCGYGVSKGGPCEAEQ